MVQATKKRNRTAKPSPPPEYLSVPDFAKRIGISERKAWDLVNAVDDPLPTYRLGSKIVRIRISEGDAWMMKYRVDQSKVDRIAEETIAEMKSAGKKR